MSSSETRIPAECDGIPQGIVFDADRIFAHITDDEPTPIVWRGDTEDPFRLEVVASKAQEQRRSSYGHKPNFPDRPNRLRLEARLQIPFHFGKAHFEQVRGSYLHKLNTDPTIQKLVDTRFTSNKCTALQISPLGETQGSVVTYAPYSKTGPFEIFITNDRNVAAGFAPNKAPEYTKDNIHELISSYLGMTWLVGYVLGDGRLPRARLLDRYGKGSDPFYRRSGGGRPRASSALRAEPTKQERISANSALNKLQTEYSPPAGTGSLAIQEFAYTLPDRDMTRIIMRTDAIQEPERAKLWGVTSLGGLAIAGEDKMSASTLARSIADQTDAPLFFWPTDIMHASDSTRTSEKVSRLRNVMSDATVADRTLGVVLQDLELIADASPIEKGEIARLIREAVANTKVTLIGTLALEGSVSGTPVNYLNRLGLFGEGLFTDVIQLETTREVFSGVITNLMDNTLVYGNRMFEELTHEKVEAFLEFVYGNFSISEVTSAIGACKGKKFLKQKQLDGSHPGPITIHDIMKELQDNDNPKEAHRSEGYF